MILSQMDERGLECCDCTDCHMAVVFSLLNSRGPTRVHSNITQPSQDSCRDECYSRYGSFQRCVAGGTVKNI